MDKTYIGTQFDFPSETAQESLPFYRGQRVPNFVEEVLYQEQLPERGEGGFGTVHRLHDNDENKDMAMKVPRSMFLKDPTALRRFAKEAQRLAKLPPHRNLVRIITYFEWEKWPCLFMDYIRGVPLDHVFSSSHPVVSSESDRAVKAMAGRALALEETLRLFIEICDGMDHAYRHCLVHLDLKPSNIMYDLNDGHPKVIDFGLVPGMFDTVHEAPEKGSPETTDTRTFMTVAAGPARRGVAGTLAYMAPEQFLGLRACDTRSDIYAFGVVMYQMMSGQRPFEAPASASPFDAYLALHNERQIERVPNCEPQLESIILKCLRKKPLERYQTFAELRETLDRLFADLTGNRYHLDGEMTEDADQIQGRALTLLQDNISQPGEALKLAQRALALEPDHLEARLTLANALLNLKRYEEALAEVDAALRQEPNSVWGLSLKGHIYFNQGRYEEALPWYKMAKEQQADDIGCWINLANTYTHLKRYLDAEHMLEQAAQLDPEYKTLMDVWVSWYISQNRAKEAIAYLQPHLENDWDGQVHLLMSRAMQKADKKEESAELLERYLADNPWADLLWNELGVTLYHLKRHDKADEAYRKALALESGSTIYASNLINTLHQAGRNEEAVTEAERWLVRTERQEPNAHFWNHQGLALDKLDRYDQAAEAYRKALALEPCEPVYAGNLVDSLCQAGRNEEAVTEAERWLALEERQEPNAYLWNQLGLALYNLRRYEQAVEAFQKALAREPGNATYAGNIVDSLRQVGRAEEAVTEAERWLAQEERQEPNAYFWNQLGLALYNLRRYEQAVEAFQKALAREPGNATYAGNIVDSLCQAGQAEEAVAFCEQWLTNYTPNAHFQKQLDQARQQLINPI